MKTENDVDLDDFLDINDLLDNIEDTFCLEDEDEILKELSRDIVKLTGDFND